MDGNAGTRELERGSWDALILDLMPPGVDGLEICCHARTVPMAPDLVQRRFKPAAPNALWSGDIRYIATEEGWLYSVAVLDLHRAR